jgi:outer membrane protein assembly factor BamB
MELLYGLVTLLGSIASQERATKDWPRWRGPHGDGICRETGLLKRWPDNGPPILWKVDLGGGYSSVTVAEGRLYTHTAKDKKVEIVLCLDAATGKEIWRYGYPCDYDRAVTLKDSDDTGPRATPTVDGDRVFTIGTTGVVLCLAAATGAKVWEHELQKIGARPCPLRGYCASPLVVGNHLYVQAAGRNGNSLVALDKKDGRLVWQSLDDPIGYATPIWFEHAGIAQVLFYNSRGLVAVAPEDGRLLWRYTWKLQPDNPCATPIYADGHVFASAGHGVGGVLLRLQDGKPETVWKSRAMQSKYSTAALYQGYLYGFSNSRLVCLELATGKPMWDRSGLGHGSLVIAEGHLILLGEAGDLVLAEATSKGFVEKGRCKPLDGACLSVPVVARGRLYVRHEWSLVALDLKEK